MLSQSDKYLPSVHYLQLLFSWDSEMFPGESKLKRIYLSKLNFFFWGVENKTSKKHIFPTGNMAIWLFHYCWEGYFTSFCLICLVHFCKY